MSRPCTGIRISFLILFLPFFSFSQAKSFDTASFYRHLVKENLLPEQVAFCKMELKNQPDVLFKDSLYLNLALAYYKLDDTSSANKRLNMLPVKPRLSQSSAELYLSMLITGKEYKKADTFLVYNKQLLSSSDFGELSTSMAILERRPIKQDTAVSGYSPVIADIKHRYENEPGHSAFLAGAFSAIIPGMGKFYLGYKQEALSAFVGDVLLGAQTAESYIKAGPKSARFILTGSLFGLFYGGNIWGSVVLAKKQKRDYKKQLDYEIYNYYNTRIADGSH